MELKAVLELLSNFVPLVWKQVRVGVERDFHLLMPQAVSDCQGGEAQLYQKAGMAVTSIVTTKFDNLLGMQE